MIKAIIPSSDLIIRSKNKKISSWLQDTNKLFSPFFWFEVYLIPIRYIIIHSRATWQWYITS